MKIGIEKMGIGMEKIRKIMYSRMDMKYDGINILECERIKV